MEWVEQLDDDDDLEELTRRYLPDTVVWTTDWTTGSLSEQIARGVFDVDPPFQRRNAWDDKKSSLYIESLLLGCPVPPITLAELSRNDRAFQYIVIDGKQRLSTLKRFAVDDSLVLEGLKVLPSLNGLRFEAVQASPEYSRFANLPIRTVILRNWQQDEVLQFVFNRLNTQATPLSTQELRRSLFAGPFMDFLDVRSAESGPLKELLNIEEPDYRLRDAELLLRALAFVLYLPKYAGNLKKFLDTTTRSLNKAWRRSANPPDVLRAADEIDAAMAATFRIFGAGAFQRAEPDGHFTNRFNRAVFDLMVTSLSDPAIRAGAVNHEAGVRAGFIEACREAQFARYLSSTTKTNEAVKGRFARWVTVLESAGIAEAGSLREQFQGL